MTKARENSDYTGLAADIVAGDTAARAGRKNLIINGGMQVSQRGNYTSATSVTSTNYYLDRHNVYLSGVTATVQHTDVTIGGVSKKALKIVATSSGTGYAAPRQAIELSNIQVGKTYTFSCWIRSNNANTRFRQNGFGAGANSNSPVFTNDGNWEKVSWTLDSTGTTGNPSMYLIQYAGTAVAVSSGDYIEFTDFQLEVGSVATDFEHRSYGEILADCQRFYQQYGTGIANTALFSGTNWPGNNIYGVIQWKQPMRAAPTVTFSSQTAWIVLTSGAVGATTYIAANTVNQYSAELNITANIAITAGYSGWIRHQASSYMYVSAEL